MSPIDLRPDHLTIVRKILRRHVPHRQVLAFGSRASWTAKDYSDLDLAILGNQPLPVDVASALAEAFVESDLPFKVDLVDWARADGSLRFTIGRDGVILWALEVEQKPPPIGQAPRKAGVSSEWKDARLGDIVELKRGYDLPKRDRRAGSIPLVSSSGVTDHHAESKVVGPGVVTGRYGTLGEVFFVPEDFWPLNTTLYVQDFKGNDPRFVSYLLRTIDVKPCSDKAAVPSLNRNHLHDARVCYPTNPDEQRAIAHILGTLDDKIELNRRMNQALEAVARAVFKSWFADFDPVRGKIEGLCTCMSKDIVDLFPDRFVDYEIGSVPEGWEISEIGREVNAVGGATPSTKESAFWDRGIHAWATPKDLSTLSSLPLLETTRRITDDGLDRISSGLLPEGTVLLSSRAPIGYLAITEVPTAVNQGFIAMVCQNRLSNLYIVFWCGSNLQHIKGIAGGSTFAEISKRVFRPMPVIVPPPAILDTFEAIARPLYKRIVAITRETATLARLRDLLLPKLVSGEIRANSARELTNE